MTRNCMLVFAFLWLWPCISFSTERPENVGFYYGSEAPIGSLYRYDWLVMQPELASSTRLSLLDRGGTLPIAYVAVDEIAQSHTLFPEVQESWKIGANTDWDSAILDLRLPEVQDFILEKRIAPAMAMGFQGVFLDTLDSHLLTEPGRSDREAFIKAQASLISAIRQRYPETRIIINRGFHLPPGTHEQIDALAFESYLEGYDPGTRQFGPVPESNREWLDRRFQEWRGQYPDKPLIAIDYTPTANEAPALAARLRRLGFIPYVTNPDLTRLGPTQPSTINQHVLVMTDLPEQRKDQTLAHQKLGIVLENLGLVPVYRSVLSDMPDEPLGDRYAGVVIWWEAGASNTRVCNWLANKSEQHLPVVMLGLVPPVYQCQSLISSKGVAVPRGRGVLESKHVSVGTFEGNRLPKRSANALPVAPGSDAWLTFKDQAGNIFTPIFVSQSGGVAVSPFIFENGPDDTEFWLFDPFMFFRKALQLDNRPIIDTTTESGRRILTAHIDGDGFVSRAEQPGTPQGGEVILDQILRKYRIPHTVSVIEAEVSQDGIYPAESAEALATARRIFREPNVEVASHTYGHPFFWQIMEGGFVPDEDQTEYGYTMDIPGYEPSLEREIPGSVAFVNQLAPPAKPVEVFLWSGDARPGEKALSMVRELGLHNVNGGNTRPLPHGSQLAEVWPDGRPVGDELQVYAPVMNENVYTDLWTGPFYGYRNARYSFDLLEKPYRLKPMGIYYHFYSGTKPEALKALNEVYQHALSSPHTPLPLSTYARRVQSRYYGAMMLDESGAYRWRGMEVPRTVRIPQGRYPDLTKSSGVYGYADANGQRYVHLTGHDSSLVLSDQSPEGPYLRSANGPVTDWQRSSGDNGHWRIRLSANGHVPLELQFAGASSCRIESGPKFQRRSATAFELKASSVTDLVVECF